MSKFIPLTGSTNIVDQIIQRFQGVPSFDFIEYTDAQKVTGQLFFELIGDPFEPYKNLETFAQIEADPTAIDLVNNSTNAQKVITGIVAEVVGFALDAPDVKAYAGNDGFILLAITNAISTPEASFLQYRIDRGGWITLSTLTNQIETSYVVLPELPNNQQFTIEARQSLFGTPSLIASRSVTTTPTVANWNAFFNDVSTRNYFYNDSYVDNNTYGALTSKTVMEMIFGSEGVVDAIYSNNNTIAIADLNANNLSTLVASEKGMVGLANNSNGFEYAIANQDYMTAIDNVDQAVRILILEQTSTQDYTNFTNVADFIDDQNAMAEVAASTDAMRALIASANAVAEKVIEPIALNEVFASEQATLIVANNADAVTEVANSTIAMGVLDNYDLALRIMLLELTDQDYTQFGNVQAVIDDETAVNVIVASLPNLIIALNSLVTNLTNNENAMTIIAASETSMTIIAASETIMTIIAASETAMTVIAASETAMTVIVASETATNAILASQTAINAIVASDLDNEIKYSLLFTEHTFTNAGAQGAQGPTLAQIQSAYSNEFWASDTNILNMTGFQGYQEWKVPRTGLYEIEVVGAGHRGGTSFSNQQANPAIVKGKIQLTKDTILNIVVGQRPGAVSANEEGGAGGSFIGIKNLQEPFMVAGGVGGTAWQGNFNEITNASLTTAGQSTSNVAGGVNGNGGGFGGGTSGTGGAGYLGNGQGTSPALSYQNGLIGSTYRQNGGFGGGGGSGDHGGGGGGGYSGGAPQGFNAGPGGGGGSFASNLVQDSNISLYTVSKTQDGFIKITAL